MPLNWRLLPPRMGVGGELSEVMNSSQSESFVERGGRAAARYAASICWLSVALVALGVCGGSRAQGTGIQISYAFGKNHLDTRAGIFTKDLVDSTVTTPLKLTENELNDIVIMAEKRDFFEMSPEMEGEGNRRVPCFKYRLTIEADGRRHTVRWDDCRGMPKKLRELHDVVIEFITSKPEYKALPEPVSGYL